MVESTAITGLASGLGNFLLTTFFFLIIAIGLAVAAYLYYANIRRFRAYKVTIFEPDGTGGLHKVNDVAGIFVDKATNNKRLWLKKMKVGLNADKIPYLYDGKTKMIYLFRTGLKNFRYLNFKSFINNLNQESFKITVGEEDVNWALNEIEKSTKTFTVKNKIMEMLPYITVIFAGTVVLILSIYIIKTWPDMISQISESSKSVAEALREVSRNTGGTKII